MDVSRMSPSFPTAHVEPPARALVLAERWTLVQWFVTVGAEVHLNQKVAKLRSESGAVDYAVSPKSGTVTRLLLDEGANVQGSGECPNGATIAEISFCDHPISFKGVCAVCGADISSSHYAEVSAADSRMPAAYNTHTLSITRDEVQSAATTSCINLLTNRRLSLVLDLDHTLVHATDDVRAAAIRDFSPPDMNVDSIHSFSLETRPKARGLPPTTTMFVKLRPHLRTFLRRMSKRFELSIYTMGTRPYAEQITRIIDPDKSLFRARVTSREDYQEGTMNQKNLSKLFPCDDSMVMIVDDREDVWRDGTHKFFFPNLIRCKPYFFWTGFSEAYDRASIVQSPNASNSASSKPTGGDEAPTKSSNVSNGHVDKDTGNGSSESAVPTRKEDPAAADGKEDESKADHSSSQSAELNAAQKEADDLFSAEMRALAQDWWDRDSLDEWGDHLLHLADVLEVIHVRFFEKIDAVKAAKQAQLTGVLPAFPSNAKTILADLRRMVFKDCTFTFTGIFPRGSKPEESWEWNVALLHGAVCSDQFTSGITTHVIASPERGAATEKSKSAVLENTAFCVSESWLRDSVLKMERLPELSYTVHPHCSTTDWVEFRKEVDTARQVKYEALVKDVRKRNRDSNLTPDLLKRTKLMTIDADTVLRADSDANAHSTDEQPAVGHALTADEVNDALDSLL